MYESKHGAASAEKEEREVSSGNASFSVDEILSKDASTTVLDSEEDSRVVADNVLEARLFRDLGSRRAGTAERRPDVSNRKLRSGGLVVLSPRERVDVNAYLAPLASSHQCCVDPGQTRV